METIACLLPWAISPSMLIFSSASSAVNPYCISSCVTLARSAVSNGVSAPIVRNRRTVSAALSALPVMTSNEVCSCSIWAL